MSEVGITSFGAYVPRLRMSRAAIANSMSWLDPTLRSLGKGGKAICNWDEDSLTMAVEAARDCLNSIGKPIDLDTVALASTTTYFVDRSNATVVADALGLGPDIGTTEYGGSRRAATSALISSIGSASIGADSLVVTSENLLARPGSIQDLTYGHAAAAITVSLSDMVVARYLAHHCISHDIVDHYRSASGDIDYVLEERWVRDEGWLKAVTSAIDALLAKADIAPDQIKHTLIPAPSIKVAQQIAKRCRLPLDSVYDLLHAKIGDTGTVHPLLLLVACLETAQPGDIVLLTGFGQGCDALLFLVTDGITEHQHNKSIMKALKNGHLEENYVKYLAFSNQISVHYGMRAEHDKRTAHSVAHRKHEMISGLSGGKCSVCGTVQFPLTRSCVNPNCGSFDSQIPFSLREDAAGVKTFTEDWLAYSLAPPLTYGNIQFNSGANIMMEITDVEPGDVFVGMPVRPVFRIKDTDDRRGFRRYFWKVAPQSPIETRA